MSITVSNPNVRIVVLLKIQLDSGTLRFATENIMAKDIDGLTYFWEGRLASVGDITAGFNDFKTSSSTVSAIQVDLYNGKSTKNGSNLDTFLTQNWGNKQATLFVSDRTSSQIINQDDAWFAGDEQYAGDEKYSGQETLDAVTIIGDAILTQANVIFSGIVAFPNYITQFDDQKISITIADPRYNDQLLMAPSVFKFGEVTDETTFDYLGSGVEGQVIPIVYGDFSDEATIPVYDIGPFGTTNKTFKVADTSVLADGQDPLVSVNSFLIGNRAIDPSYDPAEGVVFADDPALSQPAQFYVACQGKTRGTAIAAYFGGLATTLLQHPIEIIYDLIVNQLLISSSLIDSSFLTLYNLDTTLVARRWFGGAETIVSAIDELSFEFGLDLTSYNGMFYLTKPSLSAASVLSLSQDHLDLHSYNVQIDPNRSYFNSSNILFQFSPRDQAYTNASRLENSSRIAQHLYASNFPINMNWSYKEAPIVERIGFLMYLFSRPIRFMNGKFRSIAWNIKPNDMIDLTFHIYNGQKFLVRSVGKSLNDFSTAIKAIDIGTPQLKNWAANADIDPTSYANAQVLTYGIWHADSIITAGFNDTLKITTTSGTFTVDLPTAAYDSAATLAADIQAAINAVSAVQVTITYNVTTRKFTIATNDASNFTLAWTDTPEIGRSTLGFNVASNSTGAATYTSAYICVFDLGEGEAVTQWA